MPVKEAVEMMNDWLLSMILEKSILVVWLENWFYLA
jgi:hypothetical protein